MKVLSLMAERARAEADGGKPVAKAINTSGIVAVLEPHKVVQRCDALASNIAGEFDSVLANCLTHGRR